MILVKNKRTFFSDGIFWDDVWFLKGVRDTFINDHLELEIPVCLEDGTDRL